MRPPAPCSSLAESLLTLAADAARALEPLAGQHASTLLRWVWLCIILQHAFLPGITASAICEAFGWERGADRSWQEAPSTSRALLQLSWSFHRMFLTSRHEPSFGIMMAAQVINAGSVADFAHLYGYHLRP